MQMINFNFAPTTTTNSDGHQKKLLRLFSQFSNLKPLFSLFSSSLHEQRIISEEKCGIA